MSTLQNRLLRLAGRTLCVEDRDLIVEAVQAIDKLIDRVAEGMCAEGHNQKEMEG